MYTVYLGLECIRSMMIGDQIKAEEYFLKSYQPYIQEPFKVHSVFFKVSFRLNWINLEWTKVWTESRNGHGAVNFITGAGGFLQTLVFGYGGVRVHPNHLLFEHTYLPPGTDALNLIGIDYLNASFDVRLTLNEVTYTCHRHPSAELELHLPSGEKTPFICDGMPWS